jgi:hypothetical protein
MECVSTVQYSVRLNNMQLEPFKPSRGLHQGDLLSSYIFLFVADGLSQILQHEVSRGRYMNSRYIGELQAFHIYCLQMTRCCFWKLQKNKPAS